MLLVLAAPARASTPSTVTLRGDASHDNRVTGAPEPSLGIRWAAQLGEAVSYPVIAEGLVFVTIRPADTEAYGTELVALDLATGAIRWRLPVAGTYYWSALAYGDGRLYLVNFNGQLTALDTGDRRLAVVGQAQPVLVLDPARGVRRGRVPDGLGLRQHGLRRARERRRGGVVEGAPQRLGHAGRGRLDGPREHGLPARDGVRPRLRGRALGAPRRLHRRREKGTPALHAGRMYPLSGNPAIYDAATGAVVGTAGVGTPAFADGAAYLAAPTGGVFAVNAANWGPRWASSIGGGSDAPLLSANHVYVGSEDGYVAALSRADGAVRWCAATGLPVQGSTGNVDRPGLRPGRRRRDACRPGRRGADRLRARRGRAAGVPNIAVTPPPPALTIDTRSSEVVQGSAGDPGALSGTLVLANVAVELQRDVWPFDGRWEPVVSAKTGADGGFEIKCAHAAQHALPRRGRVGLTSGEKTVYAELAATLRRGSPGGPTFRSKLTLRAPRGARLPGRRVALYVLRAGKRTARLVARRGCAACAPACSGRRRRCATCGRSGRRS